MKWVNLIIGGIAGTVARYMLAGATAIKGFMGFGCKSHMHTAKLLRFSEDLPIVVEMVDGEEKINRFLPHLDEMVKEGLITLERVNVIMYRADHVEKP